MFMRYNNRIIWYTYHIKYKCNNRTLKDPISSQHSFFWYIHFIIKKPYTNNL